MSTPSNSLTGTSKQVLPPSPYLEEMFKMVRVAGTLLTGHTGHLMLLNTLLDLSRTPMSFMPLLMKN